MPDKLMADFDRLQADLDRVGYMIFALAAICMVVLLLGIIDTLRNWRNGR